MRKTPSIFSNPKFMWMAVAIAAFATGFLVINLFKIGGDQFVFTLNSIINCPLAILVAVSGLVVWYAMRKDTNSQNMWLGLVIGWILWAVAEIIWLFYALLGQEVPYPSIADFFWVIGYIPMGIGLLTRARSLPTRANRRQNIFILALSLLVILAAFFLVILPTIREFDPQRLVESILNITYPIGDLFLLIVVWRLFFTYEEGDYGFSWTLITLGVVLNAITDFVFTYSTWKGLYYPDMQANLISRLGVDVPYTFSYLVWFTGIYAMGILLKHETPIEPGTRIRLVRTYGNILIYTRKNDTVMGVSPNFEQFFGPENVKGKGLAETLGVPAGTIMPILKHLHTDGKVVEIPIDLYDQTGKLHAARLSGMAIFGPQHAFAGSNILLRMRVSDESFDAFLNEEARRMVRFILEKSGSNTQIEIGQFLVDYYLSYIKSLLDMALHQGGATAGQAFLDQLQETSNQHNWHMQFQLETVLDGSDYPLSVLREALPILLETSRQFAAQITSPAIVDFRIQQIRSRYSDSVLHDVDYYGKEGNEVGFADHRQSHADL